MKTPKPLKNVSVVIVLGSLTLGSCGSPTAFTESGDSAVSSSTTEIQDSTSPSSDDAARSGGDGAYSSQDILEEAAYWAVPLDFGDWEVVTLGEQGTNQLQNPNGCMLTTTHNIYDVMTRGTNDEENERQVELWKQTFEQDFVDPEFTVADVREIETIEGDPVKTKRIDTTYTDVEGKNYRSTAWVGVLGNKDKPDLVSLQYACPLDAYNEAELHEFLHSAALGNVR